MSSLGKDNSKDEAMELQENVLDPVNKTLCDDLFISGKEVIKSQVKDFIIDNFLKWFEKIGHKKEEVKNFYIIGSSIGFQYTEVSDIDVTVDTDLKEDEIKKLIDILPNNNNLLKTKHPINYYFKTLKETEKDADIIYDLSNDKWIKKSKKEEAKIPASYILEITKFFMSGIQDRLAELDRDKIELETFKNYSPEKLDVSQKEIDELVSQKEVEIKADLDALYVAYHIIRGFRKEAFGEEGEALEISIDINVKNPNYSINNLIYKTLEKFKYIEKLQEAKKEREELLTKK
jgi:predicted nucleotidyltransferase